jgi:hypothetical protein
MWALLRACVSHVWRGACARGSTRVCCTCDDPFNCPWGLQHNERTYCSAACHDETCQQLAAGCSVSLFDLSGQANGGDGHGWVGRRDQTNWGRSRCNEWDVRNGECGVCREPYWCDDHANPFGAITTARRWADVFFDADGGRALGARQCKWRRSQKQTFIESMRLRFERRARQGNNDHANPWNEVSTPSAPLTRTPCRTPWN